MEEIGGLTWEHSRVRVEYNVVDARLIIGHCRILAVVDPLPTAAKSAHISRGCQMQVYLDLAGKPRPFELAGLEIYDRDGRPSMFEMIAIVRVAKGVWLRGEPMAISRAHASLPSIWERCTCEWKQVTLAEAVRHFATRLTPIPPSLEEDIRDQDQPGVDTTRKTEDVGEESKPPTTTTAKPKRVQKTKPPRPTTLAELAAAIRRDNPRQRNVPKFLELYGGRERPRFRDDRRSSPRSYCGR